MRSEIGLIPNQGGMEEAYSIIPEDMRMNPDCPCRTRTCPNHGFCQYCYAHHEDLRRMFGERGIVTNEGTFCRREEFLCDKEAYIIK